MLRALVLPSDRFPCDGIDLHFNLGFVVGEIDDLVITIIIPIEFVQETEVGTSLDLGNDLRNLHGVFGRNCVFIGHLRKNGR